MHPHLFPSPLRLRRPIAAALAGCVVFAGALRGQTAITSLTTTFTTGTSTSSVTLSGHSVTFDKDTLAVSTFKDAAGDLYTVTGTAQADYIRTEASPGSTSAQTDPADISAWYMGNKASSTTSAPTTVLGSYDSGTPASMLLGNNLLDGASNLFNNVNSAGTSSNNADDVERLDLVYNGTTGETASNDLSVAVFDAGTGASFEIAIITGVNSSGVPTSYGGTLVDVTAADFGDNLLTTSNANSTVRDGSNGDPTEYTLRYDSTTSLATGNMTNDDSNETDNIAGVVLSLTDFGIASGTTIYGYSIMASDVTDGGNINNLVNYNNTTYYPTNTNDTDGGLDPAAVNGLLIEETPIPEPSAYGAIFLGLGLAGYAARRRRRGAAIA